MRLNDSSDRTPAQDGRPTLRGGRTRHTAAPMAEINIIPLVDVVLVLLIIFMATTAFVRDAGLKMKLPSAKSGEAVSSLQQNTDLTISLSRDGAIFLNGQSSDETRVRSAMQMRAKQNPQPRIIIKGDENIAYARVVRLMDMARQAGLNSIALGTRTPEGATDNGQTR